MKNILIAIVFCFVLNACAEQESSGQSKGTKTTGNKHKDAAITKIIDNNPGLTWDKGECVVNEATKDGKYGIGEINQLRFDANGLINNNQAVYKAYSDAIQKCTTS